MIASVRGTLTEISAGACVIEAGGVGYLVQISSHTAAALPPRGGEVALRTRQIVREDALQLFGFADPEELRLFDLMIGVSGVGPKLALAVLSGLRAGSLVKAIRDEHIGALVAVPGIGRKTAERLVVELRDKVDALPASGASRDSGVLPRSERFDDAVAALTSLGYTAAQAEEAVRKSAAEADGLGPEELVRRALAKLARPAVTAR